MHSNGPLPPSRLVQLIHRYHRLCSRTKSSQFSVVCPAETGDMCCLWHWCTAEIDMQASPRRSAQCSTISLEESQSPCFNAQEKEKWKAVDEPLHRHPMVTGDSTEPHPLLPPTTDISEHLTLPIPYAGMSLLFYSFFLHTYIY
jgi:hypothetical protein